MDALQEIPPALSLAERSSHDRAALLLQTADVAEFVAQPANQIAVPRQRTGVQFGARARIARDPVSGGDDQLRDVDVSLKNGAVQQ